MAAEGLITITQIRKALKELPPEDLVRLVSDLAQACPQAREYLTVKFADQKSAKNILASYKAKVEYEFFPPNGIGRLNLREAKKAISDFKKICPDKELAIDLMLFYVENCVAFTSDYGDIYESFYNSAISMYSSVVKEINGANNALYRSFADRLRAAAENACAGWGFQDEMMDIYYSIEWLEDDE
jgi:predicted ATP-binding protein involved in virulence